MIFIKENKFEYVLFLIVRGNTNWNLIHLIELHDISLTLSLGVVGRRFQFAFSSILYSYVFHWTLGFHFRLVHFFHGNHLVLKRSLGLFGRYFDRYMASYASWILVRTLFWHSPGCLGLFWIHYWSIILGNLLCFY